MCSYSYSWYCCSHDTFIHSSSIETCGNRLLSGYSSDAWSADMCRDLQVECHGYSQFYCSECSEDHSLEYELDEM